MDHPDFYQVDATVPDEARADVQQQALLMLRTLLTERFGLRLHSETRELPSALLTLASADGRLGPRLTRTPDLDCDKVEDEARQRAAAGNAWTNVTIANPPAADAAVAAPRCAPDLTFSRGEMSIALKGTSIPRFVRMLNDATGRLIVDRSYDD